MSCKRTKEGREGWNKVQKRGRGKTTLLSWENEEEEEEEEEEDKKNE